MKSRLRKKVSKYLSSPLARFRTDSSERRDEAPPDAREHSPPSQPNRIVMTPPRVTLSSSLPPIADTASETGGDSLGGETSASGGQSSGETHDKARVMTSTDEIRPTPTASELSTEESVDTRQQADPSEETITVGYRYSSEPPAAVLQQETGQARNLKPIVVAATPYEHAVASSTLSCEIVAPSQSDGTPLHPIGKWGCCSCKREHDIYYFTEGDHPVSVLNCECTHRSCGKCVLQGQIKVFQPMSEPEVVQLSEDESKQIRFGVFCDGCGVSWRAVEVVGDSGKKPFKQQISDLPKQMIKHVNPIKKLREHSSIADLSAPGPSEGPKTFQSSFNLRALSDEMEAEGHGKQAELATVHFTGINCTCGLVTCSNCLCFQVVDPPKDVREAEFEQLMAGRKPSAGFGTTPEDQARGHQTPVLNLRGRSHPNPLRSCPVDQ